MKIDSSVALIASGIIGIIGGWLAYKKTKSDTSASVTTTTLDKLNHQLDRQSAMIDRQSKQIDVLTRQVGDLQRKNAEMLTLLKINKIDY